MAAKTPARLSEPELARRFADLTYPRFAPLLDEVAGPSVVAVGALEGDEPAVLALASLAGEAAELLSVATRADLRLRGLAASALAALEDELRAARAREVLARWERGLHYTTAVEALLARRRFEPPRPRALVVRCDSSAIAAAPWVRQPLLPRAFEPFPWRELAASERAAILDEQARAPWFPVELSPFLDEGLVEHGNSLGLRAGGEVVGWQINHRVVPVRVRYTVTWVRARFQPSGLAIALAGESIRRHLAGPLADEAPGATFMVLLRDEGMVRFVRRRLAPFADSVNESMVTGKRL